MSTDENKPPEFSPRPVGAIEHFKPTAEMFAALAELQGEVRNPIKKHKVDYTPQNGGQRVKYDYADLADVLEANRDVLKKHGFAIVALTVDRLNPYGYGLETYLTHKSGGYFIAWQPLVRPEATKPQVYGSNLTYARRYSASPLLGIASETDDDAQAAQAEKSKGKGQGAAKDATPPPSPSAKPIVKNEAPASDTDTKKIFSLAKDRQIEPEEVSYFIKHVYGLTNATGHATTKGLKKWQAEELHTVLSNHLASAGTLTSLADTERAEREMRHTPKAPGPNQMSLS